MTTYNSSDLTDMIRSKRVFLGTYCLPSSSCDSGGGGGTGETGPTGPTGPQGPSGNTILNGVGPPVASRLLGRLRLRPGRLLRAIREGRGRPAPEDGRGSPGLDAASQGEENRQEGLWKTVDRKAIR